MILGIMGSDVENGLSFGLAIETSCTMGSVALGCAGRLLAEQPFSGPRQHAVEFLATVDTLCRENRVDLWQIGEVYVSYGPGSFTGLRMGVTAARTIAFAQEVRLVPVPTLEVLAQNAVSLPDPPDRAAVMLDAKRKRVYAATFARHEDRFVEISQPAELEPASFLADLPTDTVVLGEGVAAYRSIVDASGLQVAPDELHAPRASEVYRLGHELARRGVSVARRDLVPLYIRAPEAEERWAARHGC